MTGQPLRADVPHHLASPSRPRPGAEHANLDELARVSTAIHTAVESVIEGKPDVVHTAVTVLLAGGHLLVEDVPGVGKTMLAKALARSIDGTVRRVQFTPDLLPSDVTGVSIFNAETRELEFKPGAVFAHVVVGDEINRASPKTQSALLECMEERQVTVDGVAHLLEPPFIVIATQNPVEMAGTYPLPEAQRDRFMAWVSMGYPSPAAELAMLDNRSGVDPLERLSPVTDAATVARLVETVHGVHASAAVKQYLLALVTATRRHLHLRLGASPRASLQLLRAAQASAALAGRSYVLPDDVQVLAAPVLAHRLMLDGEARLAGLDGAAIVRDLLREVSVPAPGE